MSDERHDEHADEAAADDVTRPQPRNPFEEPDELGDDAALPALIQGRKSAAISGVVVGLIALVLVVGLCVAASFAFG
jgi:hypothetical protein